MSIDVGESTEWTDLFDKPFDGLYWAPEDKEATLVLKGTKWRSYVMNRAEAAHWWSNEANRAAEAKCVEIATLLDVPLFKAHIDLRRKLGVRWERVL